VDIMSALTKYLTCLAVVLPAAAWAQQSTDAAYCSALAQKYQRYVAQSTTAPRAQNPDARMNNAVAQCSSGKVAEAIPVLEKALRDAKVDLPPIEIG
jgi:hypothetical protein